MRKGARSLAVALAGMLVVAGLGTLYISQARETDPGSAKASAAASAPKLRVVAAVQGPSIRDITLLADVKAAASTVMYAKLGGYLKTLNVDRGDRVKAGQIIAEIDSPEIDSQYVSAQADLDNKRRLTARSRDMAVTGYTSTQSMEAVLTSMRVAEALVRQIGAQMSYKIIRAPFDGVVTARFADPGVLIENASTNQSSALPVVTISDVSQLRIAANVEQADVPYVRAGVDVDVMDSSHPERRVAAKVSRTGGSLDQKTRTLYVEIDLDNSEEFLAVGSFAHVTFHLPVESYPQVPTASLLSRGEQRIVALVDAQNQIRFRPVRIANTAGPTANIAEGVAVGERVLLNPPYDIAEGTRIDPVMSAMPVR